MAKILIERVLIGQPASTILSNLIRRPRSRSIILITAPQYHLRVHGRDTTERVLLLGATLWIISSLLYFKLVIFLILLNGNMKVKVRISICSAILTETHLYFL